MKESGEREREREREREKERKKERKREEEVNLRSEPLEKVTMCITFR